MPPRAYGHAEAPIIHRSMMPIGAHGAITARLLRPVARMLMLVVVRMGRRTQRSSRGVNRPNVQTQVRPKWQQSEPAAATAEPPVRG